MHTHSHPIHTQSLYTHTVTLYTHSHSIHTQSLYTHTVTVRLVPRSAPCARIRPCRAGGLTRGDHAMPCSTQHTSAPWLPARSCTLLSSTQHGRCARPRLQHTLHYTTCCSLPVDEYGYNIRAGRGGEGVRGVEAAQTHAKAWPHGRPPGRQNQWKGKEGGRTSVAVNTLRPSGRQPTALRRARSTAPRVGQDRRGHLGHYRAPGPQNRGPVI